MPQWYSNSQMFYYHYKSTYWVSGSGAAKLRPQGWSLVVMGITPVLKQVVCLKAMFTWGILLESSLEWSYRPFCFSGCWTWEEAVWSSWMLRPIQQRLTKVVGDPLVFWEYHSVSRCWLGYFSACHVLYFWSQVYFLLCQLHCLVNVDQQIWLSLLGNC